MLHNVGRMDYYQNQLAQMISLFQKMLQSFDNNGPIQTNIISIIHRYNF